MCEREREHLEFRESAPRRRHAASVCKPRPRKLMTRNSPPPFSFMDDARARAAEFPSTILSVP